MLENRQECPGILLSTNRDMAGWMVGEGGPSWRAGPARGELHRKEALHEKAPAPAAKQISTGVIIVRNLADPQVILNIFLFPLQNRANSTE